VLTKLFSFVGTSPFPIANKDEARVKTTLYAFNISRQSFINLGVSAADTPLARLRGLLGRLKLRSDEAVWVVPSRGIHTFGLLFAIDAIYLDSECRVVHLIENLGPLRVGPLRLRCSSVLELPAGSIYKSGTQVGDRLLIKSPEQVDRYMESRLSETPEAVDTGR
jgi:uncharacterized membrane protein (UPF0127 family)